MATMLALDSGPRTNTLVGPRWFLTTTICQWGIATDSIAFSGTPRVRQNRSTNSEGSMWLSIGKMVLAHSIDQDYLVLLQNEMSVEDPIMQRATAGEAQWFRLSTASLATDRRK